MEELESLGGINSAATRVRCFAHILNLVVKVRTTLAATPLCLMCSLQAIILIFAQKRSTSTTADDEDDDPLSEDESEEENTTPLQEHGADDSESGSESETAKVMEDDEYEVDTEREAADEVDIEEIIKEVASEQNLSESDRSAGQYAVTKVR